MSEETPEISNEQTQNIMNAIAECCERMELEPEQILDGVSRSLLSIMSAFETKELNVVIEKVGTVNVHINDDQVQ